MNLIMKVVNADGTTHGGFVWPLTVGATVEAPECGNGLHGWLNGEGYIDAADICPGSIWLLVGVRTKLLDLGAKVRFRKGTILAVGTAQEIAAEIIRRRPGSRPHYGTHATGEGGTARGGYGSTVTGGRGCTITGGDGSAVSGGACSDATGGAGSVVSGGAGSTVRGGHGARIVGGDRSELTVGWGGRALGSDYCTIVGGCWSVLIGGKGCAITGGTDSAVTGGLGSVFRVEWLDPYATLRTAVAYVGEDGILPDVPYRVDESGKFVPA
jgi:hypothetical protein